MHYCWQLISKFPGGVQNYIKMARQWVSEHPGTESVKGQRFTSASSLGQQTASLGQETTSAGQVFHVGGLAKKLDASQAPAVSISNIAEFKA